MLFDSNIKFSYSRDWVRYIKYSLNLNKIFQCSIFTFNLLLIKSTNAHRGTLQNGV